MQQRLRRKAPKLIPHLMPTCSWSLHSSSSSLKRVKVSDRSKVNGATHFSINKTGTSVLPTSTRNDFLFAIYKPHSPTPIFVILSHYSLLITTMAGDHVGKEEASEKHGHGTPHESPEKAKENAYLGKIFRDMLDILKQVCLLSCFELFPKHHRHPERVMKDLSSQSQEASATPSSPVSSSASNQLPLSVGGGTKDKGKDKGKDKDKDKGKDKGKDKDKGKGKGK